MVATLTDLASDVIAAQADFEAAPTELLANALADVVLLLRQGQAADIRNSYNTMMANGYYSAGVRLSIYGGPY